MNSSYFTRMGQMYLECCKQAFKGLKRNPSIILGSVAAYVIFLISAHVFSPFGMAGGMIVGLIHIALVSLYYSWIADTTQRDRLTFRNLWNFDYGMFSTVISVAFIIWIAKFIVESLVHGLDGYWIIKLMNLAIFLIFNAVPEVIYLQRIESIPALSSAASFTQRHWIEWYIPLLIILIPWMMTSALTVLFILAGSEILLPSLTVLTGVSAISRLFFWIPDWLTLLLGIVIANWYMLFRAQLFQSLESGKYRARPSFAN